MSDINKNKVIGIVAGLIPAELPLFRSWIGGGAGNDMLLLLLFDYYCATARNMKPGQELSKQDAWKSCFPKQKYNDSRFRYLNSDLVVRLEEFIAHRGYTKNQQAHEEVLSRELGKRGATKAWQAHFGKFEEYVAEQQIQDADYYSHAWEMEFMHLSLTSAGKVPHNERTITRAAGFLDRFYLIRKLQLCCEIFNVQNVFAGEHQVFLLDEILSHLANRSYEDVPVIVIYFRILMTLRESENEEHYHVLRGLLREHEAVVTKEELRDMYKYVLNYCIKKINLGNISWQNELFDIYKTTLENRVLLTEGFLSHRDFKNIVTISLRLHELKWAEAFIRRYIPELQSHERENARMYNTANLLFHTGDFSGALRLLQQVDFSDIFYDLDARSIVLKTWFELDEEDSFEYHATAFRTFLKRNKSVSEYQRTIYENLIQYTSRLMKAGTKRKQVEKLREELTHKKNVADLRWLLGKIEERA
ncbi:MAG TPA: hypothetical protein VK826_08300 [Bacteroidia bacterium]|nr:hypothetical protein [Bacteroidia bacterium]